MPPGEELLPHEEHGVPGAVRSAAAPRVERFLAAQLSACPGQIISGTLAMGGLACAETPS